MEERYRNLHSYFISNHPDIPFSQISIACAPGRINLIGEHIDYNGYGVLPCAIENRVLVLTSFKEIQVSTDTNENLTSNCLIISENRSEIYPIEHKDLISRLSELETSRNKSITWSDYLICGYDAAIKLIKRLGISSTISCGENYTTQFQCCVEGNIPQAAGLSSSSALIVAAALSFFNLFCHDNSSSELALNVDDNILSQLAGICASSEKLVGTMGGGMDQTVSCLGRSGFALHVTFPPYSLPNFKAIPLPPDFSIVVAQSLVPSEKAAGSRTAFNLRVVECRLAALFLAKRFHFIQNSFETTTSLNSIRQLSQIEDRLKEYSHPGSLLNSGVALGLEPHWGDIDLSQQTHRFEFLLKVCDQIFHSEPYTVQEILQELKDLIPSSVATSTTSNSTPTTSGIEFSDHLKDEERFLEIEDSTLLWQTFFPEYPLSNSPIQDHTLFHLLKRARHVFSEASRVEKFINICIHNNSSPSSTTSPTSSLSLLPALGALLSESQSSLRDDYDCSCPELDELIHLCHVHPACVGARLTGAGWGGSVIAAVFKDQTNAFMEYLSHQEFYRSYLLHLPIPQPTPHTQDSLTPTPSHTAFFLSTPSSGASILSFPYV